MPVFDPRWSNLELSYTRLEGGLVLVEGDLILGTEEDVLRRSFRNAVKAAKEFEALPEPNRTDLLTALPSPEAGERLRRLANTKAGDIEGADRTKLDLGVKNAVEALRPLQNLRPAGPPTGVQAHAVAVFAGASREFRWPDGVIPYEDVGVPHPARLKDAMKHWETETNVIRFVKRDAKNEAHRDFVQFERGATDCYAYSIGRTPGLGAHRVVLGPDCGKPQIIHEIGHIVGLFHEHCRTDRDKYITIKLNNMKEHAKSQFGKVLWNAQNLTPFDFESIMMYPHKAFVVNLHGEPTIEVLPEHKVDPAAIGLETGVFGGKKVGLSTLDIQGVRRMYSN